MEIQTHTQSVGELQWFYRQVIPDQPRDRPPVVLLHDLPAQSYTWREVMPALAEQGFRAIAPDWPGYGQSSAPGPRQFDYSPAGYAQALGNWLAALEIERCTLVVQGFMGVAGLQYAVAHPEQVSRLAVFNTPLTPTAKLPWKISQFGLPLAGDMLTQNPILVDRTLEGGGGYQVEEVDLGVYRKPYLSSSDAGRALMMTVKRLKLGTVMPDLSAKLQQWPNPLLIAWGDRDPWLSLDDAKAFAANLSADFEQLVEVGHYPQEDWPEKVKDALIPFLRAMDL